MSGQYEAQKLKSKLAEGRDWDFKTKTNLLEISQNFVSNQDFWSVSQFEFWIDFERKKIFKRFVISAQLNVFDF